MAAGTDVLDVFLRCGARGGGGELCGVARGAVVSGGAGAVLLLVVITIDLPGLPKNMHDRFFWILTVRETCFAGGAMVLAGHCMERTRFAQIAKAVLVRLGRFIVAATMIFYGIEHFLHPWNVPGVPLEKMTPAWIPGAVVIAYFVGVVLLVFGAGRAGRPSKGSGLSFPWDAPTALFYVPGL